DRSNGFGGFTSLLFNATPRDQLRLVTSLRQDHFQVPKDPGEQGSVIRDARDESDALANFSWIHTASPGLMWTISPFYHFNRAHYTGGANDNPLIPEDDRGSTYLGGHLSLAVT